MRYILLLRGINVGAYHKKLMKQEFYKEITIRNGNTFEKIAEIFENER